MKNILEKVRARFNAATDKNDEQMTLTIKNYILLIAGFVVIIIGMVLMAGGGSDDPNVFNYDMFSWRRITLAPILIVGGFAFEVYALLKKF
jgi:membrane-bound ClpP family serine protease